MWVKQVTFSKRSVMHTWICPYGGNWDSGYIKTKNWIKPTFIKFLLFLCAAFIQLCLIKCRFIRNGVVLKSILGYFVITWQKYRIYVYLVRCVTTEESREYRRVAVRMLLVQGEWSQFRPFSWVKYEILEKGVLSFNSSCFTRTVF